MKITYPQIGDICPAPIFDLLSEMEEHIQGCDVSKEQLAELNKARNKVESSLKEFIHENSDFFDADLYIMDEMAAAINNAIYKLDVYPRRVLIITPKQMAYNYTTVGMGSGMPHWRKGLEFIQTMAKYAKGVMGFAYEIVINTNPCLVYNMDSNSSLMMQLVTNHAAFGHNAFFSMNYLFKQWTDPELILERMKQGPAIAEAVTKKHGKEVLEQVQDAFLALRTQLVVLEDERRHSMTDLRQFSEVPNKLKSAEEQLKDRHENDERIYDDVNAKTLSSFQKNKQGGKKSQRITKDINFPTESLGYVLQKLSPFLNSSDELQELARFELKEAEYFYAQMQTQLMNEGFATLVHYMMTRNMHQSGVLTDGAWGEFMTSHTNVIYQSMYTEAPQYYSGINVYSLGFKMLCDIINAYMLLSGKIATDSGDGKALIEEYEKHYHKLLAMFPYENDDMAWWKAVTYVIQNYIDETFVLEFLSPKIIRDYKIFVVTDTPDLPEDYLVSATAEHPKYYQEIREKLSHQYAISSKQIRLNIVKYDFKDDRTLHLEHHITPSLAEWESLADFKDFDSKQDYEDYIFESPYVKHLEPMSAQKVTESLQYLWGGSDITAPVELTEVFKPLKPGVPDIDMQVFQAN